MNNYDYIGQGQSIDVPQAFPVLMRNVYSWMTLALVMTALTAMLVASSEAMLYGIVTNPILSVGLMIAEVGLVLILSARIMKLSFMAAGILFALYAILNGVTMSFIVIVYTSESIAQTFFVTAGTFGAMSLLGFVVKKDLSALGRILTMLLIGLVIATVVNIFMHNSGMAMVLNYAGVAIFVGLTAYDTQKIKQMLMAYSEAGVNDQTNKLALLGSLSLYLDFVNLFLYLLRIFGKKR